MARKLEVEIIGDASSLQRALRSADSSTSKFGGTLGRLAKGGAIAAGAAGVGGLIFTLKTGISEWKESTQVAAQTNAVIKSTGGAAGITAKHVHDLATEMMKKTGIDDEAIQTSENLLLAFTNIRNEAGKGNDIFDRATKVVQDYSVRTGKSASQASIAFGKALNDPVKGLGALGRAGVVLTDDQKKLIKGWVEHGDKLKAQKYLLEQLEKRFGGAAEAAGKTLPGQLSILREEFKNFAGDLVAKMIPVLEQTIGWLRDHWPEIKAKIQDMWAAIQPDLQAFGELVATIAGLIQKHWGTIGPIVNDIARVFKDSFKIMGDVIRIFTALLRGDWSAAWKAVKQLFFDTITSIKDRLVVFKDSIGVLAAKIGTEIKNGVVNGLQGIASAVWGVISGIGSYIARQAGDIVGWGKTLAGHLKDGIINGLKGIGQFIVNEIKSAINGLIDRFNSLMSFSFDTHIPKVGKVHVDAPDVPHLAAGGIVTQPTLAVIGERGPEAVVPLNGGGAMSQVNLVLDGKVLASALIDPFRGEVINLARRGGKFA